MGNFWQQIRWYDFIYGAVIMLMGYVADAAKNQKLLWSDNIVHDKLSDKILQHSFWIYLALLLISIVVWLISRVTLKSKRSQKFYKNICHQVFDEYIMDEPNIDRENIRISLLQVKYGLIFRRGKFGIPSPRFSIYLKVAGRYQTRQPQKDCKVIFLPGEGCAGLAYEKGMMIQKRISQFQPNTPEKYYQESASVFCLPKSKAKRLNDKASHYICIPAFQYGTQTPWGILSIDSLVSSQINSFPTDDIEEMLFCYSTNFLN